MHFLILIFKCFIIFFIDTSNNRALIKIYTKEEMYVYFFPLLSVYALSLSDVLNTPPEALTFPLSPSLVKTEASGHSHPLSIARILLSTPSALCFFILCSEFLMPHLCDGQMQA